MGTGLVEIWNRDIQEVNFTVECTGGGAINPKKLSAGKVDIAFQAMDSFTAARNGKYPFKKKFDMTNVRTLILANASPSHWVVLKKSNIYSIRDLKGKRVSVGVRGDSANYKAPWTFSVAGLKEGDVKVEYIGYTQAAEALVDGRIDCMFQSAGVPVAAMLSMSQTHELRFIELSKEEEAKLLKGWPFMIPLSIPAGSYKGQSKTISAHGSAGVLMMRKEVPEDIAYKMCKSIDNNWEYLYKVYRAFKQWKFTGAVEKIGGQPLHQGALKYYREKGYY